MRCLPDKIRADRLSVTALITQRTLRGRMLGSQSMWSVASSSANYIKRTVKKRKKLGLEWQSSALPLTKPQASAGLGPNRSANHILWTIFFRPQARSIDKTSKVPDCRKTGHAHLHLFK